MINLVKKTWIPITIIGTILVAFLFFSYGRPELPTGYTVVTQEMMKIGNYTWYFYKFDTYAYLKNLSIQIKPNYLTDIFTNSVPQIPPTPNWDNITSILRFIANCFIWVPNMFIMLFNYTILAPTQLLIYPINIMMTLLGINTTNADFVWFTNKIINFSIQYIRYI